MDIPLKFDNEMDIEEGEYGPLDDYNPIYEFPSDEPEVSKYTSYPRFSSPPPTAVIAPPLNKTTTLRLISLKSSILSLSKRVAVLDGHTEVSIGRDVALTARVRLKEMAVSKFHASIYWDGAKHQWGIVDQGSMHGTFVRSVRDGLTSASQSRGVRLSPPKMASLPRTLKHLDEITIGGTTFLVHEHHNSRPCSDCTIDDKAEIPLFTSSSKAPVQDSTQDIRKRKLSIDPNVRDPKRTMAKLKSSLMARHPTNPSVATLSYRDRSALRRELHPESKVPTPPVVPPSPTVPSQIHRRIPSQPEPSLPPPPPPPISSSSIGHKLLLLRGWNPGTALGEDPTTGLTEPLEIQQRSNRAGLGAPSSLKSPPPELSKWTPGWQEEIRRRRWDDIANA